jgi:hypothetical protein
MTCPAPIGVVPKEDCGAIAADFGSLRVDGALAHAGTGKEADAKLEAIHAVSALAQSIKDQRVKLCDAYTRCHVPLAEHDAQDQALTRTMTQLIDLWNKRHFSRFDEVVRFRDTVRALDKALNGGPEGLPVPLQPPRTLKADAALARVELPDVAFRIEAGALTIGSTNAAAPEREALIGNTEALALSSGHRYRLRVSGTYRPASPPLIAPGDEITVKVTYRADREGTIVLALRSLEDPDASESTETIHTAAHERATKEVKLTADPRQTGFSLGLAAAGSPVEIDALEVLRDGRSVVVANAGDPAVQTSCIPGRAVGGKPAPLACKAGDGDAITLGKPAGFLVLGVRDATGKRASTRTLSLEGGRSVDAAVGEDARLYVGLSGAGAATIEQVEIIELAK